MRIRSGLLTVALVFASLHLGAATCPTDQTIVSIPPHSQGGFTWGNVIRPMSDACVSHIVVDPLNDSGWYVGGINGLYQTKTNGLFWSKPVTGNVGALYLDPVHQLIYAGVGKQLWLSRDQGGNWNMIKSYSMTVTSILVVNNTLYVGLGWTTHLVPSGIYRSNLGGGFSTFLSFGSGNTGLITWSLGYDPIDDVLYAGNEIFDHQPTPYVPKMFRSPNGGGTWSSNIQGTMPNHVIDMAVRPSDGYLYALTEGLGVYGSSNNGTTWNAPVSPMGVGTTLLMDPLLTTRLFGGRHRTGLTVGDGGAWVSVNSGSTFTAIGLGGTNVSDLTFNGTRTKLYAASYASGIYVSPMP